MNSGDFTALKIGNLTARLPIVQGGMGIDISLSRLAAAVANEGGIGLIATAGIGMLKPDFTTNWSEANIRSLKKEIQKARKLSDGIIGINVMVAVSNFAEMAKAAIEEGIDVIFSGAGLPLNLPQFLTKDSKTKLVPIVSSGRAASIICKKWLERYNYLPDAIVVEGPRAGGHLGFKLEDIDNPDYSLEKLVPEVLEAVKPFNKPIPVIAAGGIYTGEDIYKIMKLGASGVQMATRFVTTHECDASIKFKQAYINSKKEDILIIKSPVGMPGRAIRNKFISDSIMGEKKPFNCPYHCIITCNFKETPYCIADALLNASEGNLEDGFVFAGENAYRAKEIVSVKEVTDSLIEEYRAAATK